MGPLGGKVVILGVITSDGVPKLPEEPSASVESSSSQGADGGVVEGGPGVVFLESDLSFLRDDTWQRRPRRSKSLKMFILLILY